MFLLTQQNNDTGQYSYQRPGAEPGWENIGLHVAGEDGVFTVTGADSDGQGVGAAQGRKAVVVYFDGKVVHVLCQAAESFPEHNHAGRAVCRGRSKQGAQSMKRWINGIQKQLQNILLGLLFVSIYHCSVFIPVSCTHTRNAIKPQIDNVHGHEPMRCDWVILNSC